MADSVEICSFLMGSNKTNNIIKWMSENSQERYIYVVPNLTELEDTEEHKSRILSIGFETPDTEHFKTKTDSFKSLLKSGKNVACTHMLYKLLDDECLKLIKNKSYIVVIDEEVSLISTYESASTSDLVSLLNDGKVSISEDDGMVVWIASDTVTEPYEDTRHKHHKFFKNIKNNSIYTTRCVKENGRYTNVFMVSQLTKDLIDCAKRIIIITYLFRGSVLESFIKLKGFKIKKFEDIGIVEADLNEVVSRITLLPLDKKLMKYKQNSTWWKDATQEQVRDISNYIRKVCEKSVLTADGVMWTCPSDRVRSISKNSKIKYFVNPKGFTKISDKETCWIGCSVRATNMYAHKKLAIHCFNRYPHVSIMAYLTDYGVKPDEDIFAASEMLQWIFRSNVRVPMGEVTLAITSKRMYDLYLKWANGEFKDVF